MKPTKTMMQNAHKVVFLIEQYPQHTIDKIIALFQLPAIDINSAIWVAVQYGFISEPDKSKGGEVKLLKKPKLWDFGDVVSNLMTMIYYCFEQLAKNETDMEENYLSNWTAGYSSQDTMIALNSLLKSNALAEYEIEDGDSAYTFYTLYENREQLWGRKQFKKDPLEERKRNKKSE